MHLVSSSSRAHAFSGRIRRQRSITAAARARRVRCRAPAAPRPPPHCPLPVPLCRPGCRARCCQAGRCCSPAAVNTVMMATNGTGWVTAAATFGNGCELPSVRSSGAGCLDVVPTHLQLQTAAAIADNLALLQPQLPALGQHAVALVGADAATLQLSCGRRPVCSTAAQRHGGHCCSASRNAWRTACRAGRSPQRSTCV